MSRYKEVQGYLDGMLPEPILTVSEWADKNRYIAPGTSKHPGQWKTSLFPFAKKIMDSLSAHSGYNLVIFMKSAQTGATEIGLNWIGYTIDNSPTAMLTIMPTEAQMKRNSKLRIDPMIKASPALSKKIGGNRRDSSNTLLQKDFWGGSLLMSGANSASGLRSMPVQRIMGDEVDGYPLDLNGEGSPLSLMEARTMTYDDFMIYLLSTPTVEGISVIFSEFEKTDQQKYFVPCPHCGAEHLLLWDNVKWKGKDDRTADPIHSPPTAHMVCPHCEGRIEEHHKTNMLKYGDWRATIPSRVNKKVIGFHINALYSPVFSWERAVQVFLRAGNDQTKLNAFTNTVKGEPSRPMTDAPKWQDIYNKASNKEQNRPNKHVKFITVGVDVQKNRLELHVVGWGYDKRRWVLDYRVLPGEVSTLEAWNELAKVVNEVWVREDGVELPMQKMCVDSGNYNSFVYKFCSTQDKKRVVPIKGQDHLGRIIGSTSAVHKTEAGKDAPGVMLVNVGSSFLKTELYGYLMLHKDKDDEFGPQGYVHLLQLQDSYFKGLVAEEERVKKDKKGRNVAEWHVIFERNEPLDTMNYARAAASLVGLDRYGDQTNEWLDRIEGEYVKIKQTPDPVVEKPSLSHTPGGFWARRK